MTETGKDVYKGGCTCGDVRYRVVAKPMFVHCCHCRWCQRESGSAFALNAMIETDLIEMMTGAPEAVAIPTNSGGGQTFMRCPTCKIALWSYYAGAGEAIAFIRVGSLDEPERMSPDIHIFTESKQPWVVIPDGATVMPEFYRAKDHWPAESLARRAAVKAKAAL